MTIDKIKPQFQHYISYIQHPMPWFILFIAGLFEVVWAVGIMYTESWTRLWPSLFTVFAMVASFYLLSAALKSIPMGTAYAVWTGIGTIGTVIYGIIFFKEPTDILRIVCIMLIICGIAGLRIMAK
jgi:quaternary ammonium compound-resistance protein SugE